MFGVSCGFAYSRVSSVKFRAAAPKSVSPSCPDNSFSSRRSTSDVMEAAIFRSFALIVHGRVKCFAVTSRLAKTLAKIDPSYVATFSSIRTSTRLVHAVPRRSPRDLRTRNSAIGRLSYCALSSPARPFVGCRGTFSRYLARTTRPGSAF